MSDSQARAIHDHLDSTKKHEGILNKIKEKLIIAVTVSQVFFKNVTIVVSLACPGVANTSENKSDQEDNA